MKFVFKTLQNLTATAVPTTTDELALGAFLPTLLAQLSLAMGTFSNESIREIPVPASLRSKSGEWLPGHLDGIAFESANNYSLHVLRAHSGGLFSVPYKLDKLITKVVIKASPSNVLVRTYGRPSAIPQLRCQTFSGTSFSSVVGFPLDTHEETSYLATSEVLLDAGVNASGAMSKTLPINDDYSFCPSTANAVVVHNLCLPSHPSKLAYNEAHTISYELSGLPFVIAADAPAGPVASTVHAETLYEIDVDIDS